MFIVEVRTVRHVRRRKRHAGLHIDNLDFSRTTDHLVVELASFVGLLQSTQLIDAQHTVVSSHDAAVCGHVTGHTTDVERTQGQLSTRLTDGLCGNHTDSLTNLHHLAGSQVTTVTLLADTVLGFAGRH